MQKPSWFTLNEHLKILALNLSVLLVFATGFMMPQELAAQGDLMITPRRIVFEGNKNRDEITLANTGQDTSRYTVSFVQYRMNQDGSFEQIETPEEGQSFADPYLRFFPRSVILAPGESQIVRMQLRKPGDMQEGEYRSHLYFRAVPEEKALGEEELTLDTGAIGIRLTPVFGITIPVIIRHGNLNLDVGLSDIMLIEDENGRPLLNLTLTREGSKSVFGDLIVSYTGGQIRDTIIGIVRGIAVYTPNSERNFSMYLNVPEGIDLSTGQLNVKYVGASDTDKKIIAEAVVSL